jgi:TrmH family RNA methyltransferase
MLSKNKIFHLTSLQNKKFREQFCEFLLEGDKIVKESLVQKNFKLLEILAVERWVEQNAILLSKNKQVEVTIISEKELGRISSLKSPNQVMARLAFSEQVFNLPLASSGLTIYLDGVQDPGNAGTIIRTAEWFGVKQIIFSPDSVDRFNTKFLQSCMGSIFRVTLLHIDYKACRNLTLDLPWWGASLSGKSINDYIPSLPGVLVMGNEGSGIRPEVEILLDEKLKIPKNNNADTESLNVSVATGILLSKLTGL